MEKSESTLRSNGSSIGSWIKKKRYDDDDLCISPPSDDTGFLPLNFGVHQTKPQPSMFDRINEELGFTTKNSHNSKNNYGSEISTSLKYGSNGIFLETSSSIASEPLGSVITVKSLEGINSPNSVTSSLFLGVENESEKATENEETLICKTHRGVRHRKINKNIEDTPEGKIFLGNIQNLSLMYSEKSLPSKDEENEKSSAPPLEVSSEPTNSLGSLNTSEIIERRRRRSSVPSDLNKLLIDQSIQNAFFTGGLFSSNSSSKISMLGFFDPSNSISSASNTLSVPNMSQLPVKPSTFNSQNLSLVKQAFLVNIHGSKVDGQQQESAAVEAKYFKRRPKASHLREMNIWSPQSM